jgi:hypothetical protein
MTYRQRQTSRRAPRTLPEGGGRFGYPGARFSGRAFCLRPEAGHARGEPGQGQFGAPDVVRRAGPAALPPGAPAVLRGARAVAEGTVLLAAGSRLAELALVNGTAGAIVTPGGRLRFALVFAVEDGKIAEYTVIADPGRLRRLSVAVLG